MNATRTILLSVSLVLSSGMSLFGQTDPATNAPRIAAEDSTNEPPAPFVIKSADGICDISIDTSKASDLTDWAQTKLAPALAEWFPKIVALLPVPGYTPPSHFSVAIRPGNGVAATSGTRVTANSDWLKRELKGEAVGALIHEEVHVIQLYRPGPGRSNAAGVVTNTADTNAVPRTRRGNQAGRLPGWLVEAIPDYIRWFKFEPDSHGADDIWLQRQAKRNLPASFAGIHYDTAYRPGANFLNWVAETYDQDIVPKLNAAAREGKYADDVWRMNCKGKTAAELGVEWKLQLARKFNIEWTPPGPESGTNGPAANPGGAAKTNLANTATADK